ncbi:MAG: c-type cytochrome [Rubellimicrobium sp.]|nr:c-type cytochrome [Rubellimicrobium sp.]
MRTGPAMMAILALAACVAEEPEVSGRTAFMANCSVCHGADGRGSLANGITMAPAAPDLTMLSANNGGVFPRDFVMSTIDGYSRGTHLRTPMPEFGAGDLGPTVIVENPDGTGTPVPAVLLALSEFIATLQE